MKGLISVSVHFFLIVIIFIEIFHPGFLLLLFMLCESPQGYHFTISSEAYVVCKLEDSLLHRHPSPYENFSVIEGIWCSRDDLGYYVVSKIIEGFNVRQRLGRFNQNQVREIFQGFRYEIMNYIGGERGIEGNYPFSVTTK